MTQANPLELARQLYPNAIRAYALHDRPGVIRDIHVRLDVPPGDNNKFRWVHVDPDGEVEHKRSGVEVEPLYGFARAMARSAERQLELHICEGERDCEALWALGFDAVSTVLGASKPGQAPKWNGVHTEAVLRLRPRRVTVIADADEQGLYSAEMGPARHLEARGIEVHRMHPRTGDLAEHLESGRRLPELLGAPGGFMWNGQGVKKGGSATNAEEGDRPFVGIEYTDSTYAEGFAKWAGDRVRFSHRHQRWLVYRGHQWQPDTDGEVRRLSKEFVYIRMRKAVAQSHGEENSQRIRKASSFLSRDRRNAVLDLAKNEQPITDSGEGWDAHPYLVGLANGVVDLRTGKFRDGKPEDRISLWSPIEYDPAAECPRFLKFIGEVFARENGSRDEELEQYVQRALGYSLTGETSEQVLFLCIGTEGGANGKGTLFRAVQQVFGYYVATLPFSVLADIGGKGSSLSRPYELADLPGKRVVISSETAEGAWFNTARIKALTGEDTLNVQKKYGQPFEFRPSAKYWLAVNYPPKVPGGTSEGAFFRRVRVLPFIHEFPVTPTLEDELRAEAAGILMYCIEGAIKWYVKHSLGETPNRVLLATEHYKGEQDPLHRFFEDMIAHGRLELDSEYRMPKAALNQLYHRWCQSDATNPVRDFAKCLRRRGLTDTTIVLEGGDRVSGWRGVRTKV